MDLQKLPKIEKEIYWICYEKPSSVYDILAKLSIKEYQLSYSYICQKCGILLSKGFLKKILSAKKIFYSAIEIKLEEKENASPNLS